MKNEKMKSSIEDQRNGHWMRLAQTSWILIAIIAVMVFVAAIPGYRTGFVFGVPANSDLSFVRAMHLTGTWASIIAVLLSLILAGLIFWRKSGNLMALFVSAYMLVYGVVMAGPMEALEVGVPKLAGLTVGYLQPMLIATPTILILFTFPDGKIVPGWGKWVVLGSVVWSSLLLVISPNTIYSLSDPFSLLMGIIWILSLPVAGIYAQIYRFRRVSSPLEKDQTKWVVFGLAMWVLLMIVQSIPYMQLMVAAKSGDTLPWWMPISQAAWWLSLAIIPLSLTVSILRFRLWDIDLIIRRTLQYTLLTGLLVLVYFSSVIVLQSLTENLFGEQSPLVIVLSTLAIAALFNPLRTRVQDFIDRRFYRKKYNAEQALAQFAITARDEVDMDNLASALLGVVEETMQPVKTSIWLKKAPQVRRARFDRQGDS